jgi:hypothetical protein
MTEKIAQVHLTEGELLHLLTELVSELSDESHAKYWNNHPEEREQVIQIGEKLGRALNELNDFDAEDLPF